MFELKKLEKVRIELGKVEKLGKVRKVRIELGKVRIELAVVENGET